MSEQKWLLPLKILVLVTFCTSEKQPKEDYWEIREKVILYEESLQVGANLEFSPDEEQVSDILLAKKTEEMEDGLKNSSKFLPNQHFFKSKALINKTDIFKILRRMPKGGLLNVHIMAASDIETLLDFTDFDNLYICRDEAKGPKLKFFKTPDDKCKWEGVRDLRVRKDGDLFEKYLIEHMTLTRDNFEEVFTDINKVWKSFEQIFRFIRDLLNYKQVHEMNLWTVLQNLYEDNVTYVEFRTPTPLVYDLERRYDPDEVAKMDLMIIEEFKLSHPSFIGAKMIYSAWRGRTDYDIKREVQAAQKLHSNFPSLFCGFDLIGQEDLERSLKDFNKQLQDSGLDLFYGAGEINWNQAKADQNLIDAFLLGAKRIGYGFAAINHPYIMKKAHQNKFVFEVSPIANQVLNLIGDMRNHPASIFLSHNISMVIINSAPALWGAEGVTYDWYMVFMAMVRSTAGLRLLKQLAMNSIIYSCMDTVEKSEAIEKWSNDWDKFINDIGSMGY